jgi:magnesium-transporting ATPase (P-type)
MVLMERAEREPRAMSSEDWEPEPWSRSLEQLRPAPPPVRATPPAVRPPVRRPSQPGRDRSILGIAVTHAVTAIVAFGASLLGILSGPVGWPKGIILLVLCLFAGIVLSNDEGATLFTRGWVANLVTVIAVMPLTALTVTLARQPHVSLAAGSAWSAILLALVLMLVLVATGIAFGVWSADSPDESGLLMLPVALVVPAMIGVRGEIDQQAALQAMAGAAMIAAIAAIMSWSVAPGLRAFAPPVALGLEVIVLWLAGRGPSFENTSGQVVPMLYSLLFALTVLVVVGTSIIAIIVKQLERNSRPFGRAEIEAPTAARVSARPPLR